MRQLYVIYILLYVLLAPTEEQYWSKKTSYAFRFCDDVSDTVEGYTHLGMVLNEHFDYKKGITVLS